MILILRRYRDENLELLIDATAESGRSVSIASWTERDTGMYQVELPEGVSVKPVDWRRFAYDHERVAELVGRCVADNAGRLTFSVLTGETLREGENALTEALRDLRTLFDTESVEMARVETELQVRVIGAHKNGRREQYELRLGL